MGEIKCTMKKNKSNESTPYYIDYIVSKYVATEETGRIISPNINTNIYEYNKSALGFTSRYNKLYQHSTEKAADKI